MKTYIHIIENIKYNIYIGKNAKENWNLIDNSESFDLWFHIEDYPSPHVIISQDIKLNKEIIYPKEIIKLAAEYCKKNSKLKSSTSKIKIIYTEIKNLQKDKIIGSVNVSNEDYIYI